MKYLILSLLISGCASSQMKKFLVTSQPSGAAVDVNGMNMGNTPLVIELQCSKAWVGLANAPGGWNYDNAKYEIEVLPNEKMEGFSQKKTVNACQWQGKGAGKIVFDLNLETVAPTQRLSVEQK